MKRDKTVKLSLTAEELEFLDKVRGTSTRAKYVRTKAFANPTKNAKYQQNKDLVLAVGRIGNNLNQIAKVLNTKNLDENEKIPYFNCWIELIKIRENLDEILKK